MRQAEHHASDRFLGVAVSWALRRHSMGCSETAVSLPCPRQPLAIRPQMSKRPFEAPPSDSDHQFSRRGTQPSSHVIRFRPLTRQHSSWHLS